MGKIGVASFRSGAAWVVGQFECIAVGDTLPASIPAAVARFGGDAMDILIAELQSFTESGKRRRRLKEECIEILARYPDHEGRTDARCKSRDCRWHNEDGTIGCNDKRALQFDHKDGGGSEGRTTGKTAGSRLYYEIKKHPERFQLLCANCNEIKSKGEKKGGRLHKQPQLVRRSQQIEGQPVRRVIEKWRGVKMPTSEPFSN